MVPWILLVLPFPVFGAIDKTYGVAPALLEKYSPPKSGSWKCLDGSIEIPWSSVNDDYCDCPDGSDEPGTSACPQSTFFCQNAGHIGASIPSSRVNDGLCEAECCDGSDEQPGVCPDVCQAVGATYRKKQGEERKLRKTGSKIRSSYIAFAQKEKKRLEALVATSSQEVALREKEVARLKDIAEHSESLSAAALAHRQKSPLYTTLLTHSNALKSLQREHKKHLEREKALGDILDALRGGYNPNYQDMAVLEAVRGWEALAGLPRLGEAEELGSDEEEASTQTKEEEALEEGMWSASDLETGLDTLLGTDYVSLLFEHDKHVAAPAAGSILFELSSYLPDSVLPQYEALREAVVSWLQTLGVVRGAVDGSTDTSRAREAYNNAENSLGIARKEKENAITDLADLFDVAGFGAEGEWKKLDRTCLEVDTGEYTYEICLFDEARQKPNKGGATHSLGHWASWNPSPDVTPGSPEYYSKQVYKNGAKCWNGPQRSVTLVLTCGIENAIHTVAELEKCEYQITGTSPALCLPLAASEGGAREEL